VLALGDREILVQSTGGGPVLALGDREILVQSTGRRQSGDDYGRTVAESRALNWCIVGTARERGQG
jgi:hypothetical protein